MEISNKTRIQKSTKTDAAEILRLQYAAYQSEAAIHNDYTIQPLTQTLDELLLEYQKCVVLKAVKNGEIIGSVRAYSDNGTGYIGKLIVHPDHQGQGLGTNLLAEIEREINCKRYELFTAKKSERNLYLYEKSGYKIFREETDPFGIAFVYMEKEAYNDGA